MLMLPLAVDIADLVTEAEQPFDLEVVARELLEGHPEAEACRDEIIEVLVDETAALGPEIE